MILKDLLVKIIRFFVEEINYFYIVGASFLCFLVWRGFYDIQYLGIELFNGFDVFMKIMFYFSFPLFFYVGLMVMAWVTTLIVLGSIKFKEWLKVKFSK